MARFPPARAAEAARVTRLRRVSFSRTGQQFSHLGLVRLRARGFRGRGRGHHLDASEERAAKVAQYAAISRAKTRRGVP